MVQRLLPKLELYCFFCQVDQTLWYRHDFIICTEVAFEMPVTRRLDLSRPLLWKMTCFGRKLMETLCCHYHAFKVRMHPVLKVFYRCSFKVFWRSCVTSNHLTFRWVMERRVLLYMLFHIFMRTQGQCFEIAVYSLSHILILWPDMKARNKAVKCIILC